MQISENDPDKTEMHKLQEHATLSKINSVQRV